jgi:hypothetical protein
VSNDDRVAISNKAPDRDDMTPSFFSTYSLSPEQKQFFRSKIYTLSVHHNKTYGNFLIKQIFKYNKKITKIIKRERMNKTPASTKPERLIDSRNSQVKPHAKITSCPSPTLTESIHFFKRKREIIASY